MVQHKLLFVCLGNICRSPAAEAVMNGKLKRAGKDNQVFCDSAGTIGFHSGAKADARMRKQAQGRGYTVTSISRKIKADFDFDRFDMIIGMDDQNIKDLYAIARSPEDHKKIFRMTDFSKQSTYNYIPDPYYGGADDFELVIDLLEDACDGLLKYLEKEVN
ncbi:MAG: low molecular weight protein-tyrosine-phosphatase [Mariniphaga sp.]